MQNKEQITPEYEPIENQSPETPMKSSCPAFFEWKFWIQLLKDNLKKIACEFLLY